jgi:hypothetical protein
MVSGIQLMHVSLPKVLQRTSTPGLHAREEVTHSANSAGISASKRQSSGEQTSASGALRLFIEASEATTIEAVAVKCQFGIHASQDLYHSPSGSGIDSLISEANPEKAGLAGIM